MNSELTLHEALIQYQNALRQAGKSPRTLYTYGKDCEQIEAFFGPERKLVNILPAHVSKFYKSDALLMLPNGKGRAPATVNKTRSFFNRAMTWAASEGFIKTAPLPKSK